MYAILLMLAAGVSAFAASIAWARRSIPGAISVVWLLLSLCFWSLTYALFWAAQPPMRLFWLNVTYFGVVSAPGAFFAFTLYHTGHQRWVSQRRNFLLLAVVPALTILLLWTDTYHGLFFGGKQTAESSLIMEGGVWFWVSAAYLYGLMLLGTLLLWQAWRHSHPVFRSQSGWVLFAALLPWGSNIIGITGLNPLHGLDLTPISFTLTGLILTYSLYRTGLLDLAPVARSQVVDTMVDSVIVADARQRIVDTNPSAQALLLALNGGGAGSVVGQPIGRLFPAWNDAWLTAGQAEFTGQVSGTDGVDDLRFYRVVITPLSTAREVRQGYVLVVSDVTDSKRLESALQQNLTYFRALFESSTDAVFILEAGTGNVLDVNASASLIYGYSREELIGKNEMERFLTGIAPYSKADALAWFQRARAEGPQVFEWKGLTKDNREIWLDVRIQHARLGDSERFVMTMNDITERKRTQKQQFDVALERERIQILERFIRDASHEFRTPLAAMRTGLYLLGRVEDRAQQRAKIKQVDQQITRLTRLIDMQMRLTTLDSGITLNRTVVDLNLLVRHSLEAANAGDDGPRVELALADNLDPLRLDAQLLKEALWHVIGNAVQYTDESGLVSISTCQCDAAVEIEIRDTGRGIPQEALPHIFDRFFRLDSAHTSAGFGLGLPIARQIVEAHGGQICASSTPGQGSVFTVRLPRHAPSDAL